jgi:hypothetical protein
MSENTHPTRQSQQQNSLEALPCAASPLIASACGCDSPVKIVAVLQAAGVCPMGRPDGCPMRSLSPSLSEGEASDGAPESAPNL